MANLGAEMVLLGTPSGTHYWLIFVIANQVSPQLPEHEAFVSAGHTFEQPKGQI